MLITQGNVAAIFKGYTVKFWEAYAASPAPLSDQIAMLVKSTGLSEEHNWLGATTGIRELVDEAVLKDMVARNYAIINKEWEETLTLKQIEVATDKYGLLTPRLQILGANGRYHPDIMLSDLLIKAFDGSAEDYMGGQFFDANKKLNAEDTAFTNVTTGRLNQARFRAARANLKQRLNAKGRPLGLGRDLRLIVSPEDEATGLEILTAEKINNNTNVDRGTAKLEVWPQIGATSGLERSWYLIDFASPFKPFIHQELIPWTYYTVDNPQSEYVTRFHKFIYQIYRAAAMGFGFPESIYGSDGTVA